MKGRLLLGALLIGFALLVGRAHRARPPAAPPPPPLPDRSGIWTAARQAGGFREASFYNDEGLAVVWPGGGRQFQLVLTDGLGRLAGGATPFRVTFGDDRGFSFTGGGPPDVVRAAIPASETAAWFRQFTGGGSLTVTFDDDPQMVPWVFPLAGAATAFAAMDAGMERAGIAGVDGWTPAALMPRR